MTHGAEQNNSQCTRTAARGWGPRPRRCVRGLNGNGGRGVLSVLTLLRVLPTRSFDYFEPLDVAFVHDLIGCSGSISDVVIRCAGSGVRRGGTFPRHRFCRQGCSNRPRHPENSAISSITSPRCSDICLESGLWALGVWGFLRRPVDGESVESWVSERGMAGKWETRRGGGVSRMKKRRNQHIMYASCQFSSFGRSWTPCASHDVRESPP